MSNETKEHNCGHNLVDWDGDGNCITCARDKIADPLGDMFEAMGVKVVDVTPTTQTEDDLSMVLISLAGAVRKETLALGTNAPDYEVQPIFSIAKKKIEAHTAQAVREARIDELETLVPKLDLETECECCVANETTLNNRLATLKKGDKDE